MEFVNITRVKDEVKEPVVTNGVKEVEA